MCMVSAVVDYGKGIPQQTWTPSLWAEYREIIRRLDAIDKKLDERDCDKPRGWMREVEERLARLEAEPTPKKKPAKTNPRNRK